MDFACFNCWTSNNENDQKCSSCEKDLKFPLNNFPKKIDEYKIEKSLGRGFYGVTYIAQNDLDQLVVLKVIPKELYEKYGKNFAKECKLHAEISKGTDHLLKISRIIKDVEVNFGGIKRQCDIAVLDYIEGKTLKEIIDNKDELKIETIVQVTIDLLEILRELQNKKIHHNDLHPANVIIQKLEASSPKYKNIDKFINVVAIDLGSISEESKSEKEKERKNDVHHIARYIHLLSSHIINNPSKFSQKDFRIALELDKISRWLMPNVENHRIPTYEEIINHVENAYQQEPNHWKQNKLKLKHIGQFYNAQMMFSWNVPDLFVEEDQWLNDVSSQGPGIITGMRGCGKTMLLKSMQIHARIKQAHNLHEKPLGLINNDGFLGVFISSNKLLDEPGNVNSVFEPITKLFLAYGIELIHALRHLKEEDFNDVQDDYYINLLNIYKLYFPDLENEEIVSDIDLELQLHKILSLIFVNDKKYKLPNPATLFPLLAKAIKKSSKTLSNCHILYLLDDVSTRYLSKDIITKLLSSLIFKDVDCAFKFTSEEQTMHSLLYSPGLIEKAKAGRDYEVFDLGKKVYDKTTGSSGRKFVLQILNKRKEHAIHPNISPKDVLGDTPLKEIAKNIIELKNKNEIYYGLSALTGVCVGDIGDIIVLYKNILEKRKNDNFPVSTKIQHECFLELSNIRLQDLKKRKKELENYALSFAEAANSLLRDSSKKENEKLREYCSIYVNNTSGNTEEHYNKIRELVDAGVFVFLQGSKTLRAAGSGYNPTNQFILLYRKILGLSKLIGLSQSDRFELNGKNLEDWINLPKEGTKVLKRSVEKRYGKSYAYKEKKDEHLENNFKEEFVDEKEETSIPNKEQTLLDLIDESIANELELIEESQQDEQYIATIIPNIDEVKEKIVKGRKFNIYITSLGFEERTYKSFKKAILSFNIEQIVLVDYAERMGYADQILEYIQKENLNYEIISEKDLIDLEIYRNKKVAFDITGMSKSSIYKISKSILEENKDIFIVHTFAKEYAPKEEVLKPFYDDLENSKDVVDILDKITNKVPKGEKLTEIKLSSMLNTYSDKTKNRVLIAMCNVKYEKLFHLINEREFDNLDIFVSTSDNMKNKIAKAAAKVIKISYPEVVINNENMNSLSNVVKNLTKKYYYYFVNQGYNIELALTGHKIDALACGIISSKFKIANCWYLRSSSFDENEFSQGVADTKYYEISIK